MLNKNITTAFMIGVIVLLASCAKEGPTGPTGNAGPLLTGSIGGHVKLYDQYGSSVSLSADLFKASLFLSPNGITQDSLANNGTYLFNYITTGIYSIQATDSGYATTIKNNIQLVTGALDVDIKMSQVPDSFINSFSCYHNTGSANDSLVLTFAPDTRNRYCIIFASNSPAIGSLPGTYLYSKVLSISYTAPLVTYAVPAQDLYNVGFASGNTVYYAAYSYVVADASVYEDPATGQMVYNAVNAHPIVDTTLVP